MTKLLDLPLEVRALIVENVIRDERKILTHFAEMNGRQRRTDDASSFRNEFNILYETDPGAYVTSAYSLLRTSTQINQETSSILTKISTIYQVDLAMVQGRMLWPSWTFLPRKTNDIDLLKAKLQIRYHERPCCAQRQGSRIDTQKIVHNVLFFLDHYYKFGVGGPPKGSLTIEDWRSMSGAEPSYSIKIIDIDCIESNETHEDPMSSDADRGKRKQCDHGTELTSFKPHIICATDLYKALHFEIYRLLGRLDGQSQSGQPMYSAVGKIKLRLNGELKKEIDLTAWLLRFPDQFRMQDVSPWRKRAIQFKKDRGFEIPEDVRQFVDPSDFEEELSQEQYEY